MNYGKNLLDTGNLEEAREVLDDALKLQEEVFGATSPELIFVLLRCAEAGTEPPNYVREQKYLDRALQIAKSSYSHTSIEYADRLMQITWASNVSPPSVETGDQLRQALRIYRSQDEPDAFSIGAALFRLGMYHSQRGEIRDAIRVTQESIDFLDKPDEELQSLRADYKQMFDDYRKMLDGRAEEIEKLEKIRKRYAKDLDPDEFLPILRVAPGLSGCCVAKRKDRLCKICADGRRTRVSDEPERRGLGRA